MAISATMISGIASVIVVMLLTTVSWWTCGLISIGIASVASNICYIIEKKIS